MLKEIVLPEIADNVVSGLVGSILVNIGDVVDADQPLVEVETEKATSQIPADNAGKVVEIKVSAGDTVKVGQAMVVIELSEATEQVASLDETSPSSQQDEEDKMTAISQVKEELQLSHRKSGLVPAAPSVRRLAREMGIDIYAVQGTGPGARITQDDVKAYAQQSTSQSQPLESTVVNIALPDFSKWGGVRAEKFNKIREITAQSMTTSWQTIPQVTHFDKADITSLEEFRKAQGKRLEKSGVKLTVTSILVKVVAMALQKFPNFNASVDISNKQIIYKDYYNIGIAVDTPNGLLVPVVKDADQKDLIQISNEIGTHAQKARDKSLSPDDMAGGNFTISNLGGLGGTGFTPIVYAPQVAILGVSRGELEPRYINGELQPRMMMPLTLAYDHRIIDGADAARFTRWICNVLENPFNMFI